MRKLQIVRILIVLAIGLLSGQETAAVVPAASPEQVAIRPLEVRTRRLHLVRPDLLHYPIQYDTFC